MGVPKKDGVRICVDLENVTVGCLSSVLEKKLKRDLRHSPFVGIGVDKSTDHATEKHPAIIVHYMLQHA